MKSVNFNRDWEFTFDNALDAFNSDGMEKYGEGLGAAARFYDHSNWMKIDLPHDWAVALPKNLAANTFAGGRANTYFNRFMTEWKSDLEEIFSVGWYRKQFAYDPAWAEKRVFLEFEGVFRDATLWVNGEYMDRHTSGYTSFTVEITDHLWEGEVNSVALRVDSTQPEGWWYEGAGIYRNVNLIVGEPLYVKHNKTVIKTDLDGRVSVKTVLVNDADTDASCEAVFEIRDASGAVVAASSEAVALSAYAEACPAVELRVENPLLWHVDHPNLYTLRIRVGEEIHEERFGIRTVAMDPDKGFLLNGQPLKIHGACVHQDFGGVGVALSDNLYYYKIQRLKDMGVNAYRSAHHAPSPVLLRACDELGMLVMDETRLFSTSPEAIRQLTDLVERDRNHPCVFIWSLGNEEFGIQNLAFSARLMTKISRIAKSLDDTRPVTYSGNNGPNATGANGVSEVRGVNYIYNSKGPWLDEYHRDHPHQPMIGTEESSYVLSRGGAVTDLGSGLLDSTGNVTMPWGATPKGWVKFFEMRPYLAGSFMWTGFDYRGEPNPFIFVNLSSSFGTIDLCGMEKPPFYYYKAWWTDEAVLKLTPHWNHKEGDTVTVAVFTNCEQITLSLNGVPVETRKVKRFDAPLFTLPFEAGVLSVEGRRDGKIYRDELRTSGKTASVACVPVLSAKSEDDVAIYQLEGYDETGLFCPMAGEEVELSVENGSFVGVGNGDPSSLDYEQKPAEEACIRLRNFRMGEEYYSVPPKAKNAQYRRHDWLERCAAPEFFEDDFRDVVKRKAYFKESETVTLTTKISNAEGYQYVEFERLGGEATVYLNGVEIGNNRDSGRTSFANVRPYRFYCDFAEGENELKIVSVQNEFSAFPVSGMVKIGKTVESPWKVRLHYGLARVFVKSETPEAVKITARLLK